jgi:hypothetical protein
MVTGILVQRLGAQPLICAAIAQATTNTNQPWILEVAERETEYYQLASWSGRHWDVRSIVPMLTSKEMLDKEMLDGDLRLLLPVSRYLKTVIRGCQALISGRGFKKVPLPGLPGSEEFMAAYQQALACTQPQQIGADRTKPGTVNAAIAGYYTCGAFRNLAPTTQQQRRSILERFRKGTAINESGCFHQNSSNVCSTK